MDTDIADDWAYNPTEEQMIRQRAHIVSEENRLLRSEVSRYRQHLAKMIDMHSTASAEREKLSTKLKAADSRISDLLRNASDSWGQIDSLKRIIDHHRQLLRTADISPEKWGENPPHGAQSESEIPQPLRAVHS
ncbi:hypothetical protein BB779_06250 [Pseudomonas viridiflava]|uniref:hypothetical protein n=1 Tax=Pseudomonas viridiflava TaxID=33069 RepID=UPI00083F80AB|nr:hypothetical protein [Pseudomonas viridiflava]ODJ91655.1 hypothetical protein BB779_06250 [Pseudomonas viridiflava]